MNKIIIAITFLSIFKMIEAAPISGDKLFRSGVVHDIKLNPFMDYVVMHGSDNDGYHISLIDYKALKSYILKEFPKKGAAQIDSIDWADANTIYISYTSDNKVYDAFIELDLSGDVPKPNYRKITANGYMVDLLSEEQDRMLYAKQTKSRSKPYELYYVSKENIINNNFKEINKFKPQLKNSWFYYSDADSEMLIAVILDDDDIVFWYLDKERNQWSKLMDLTDHNLEYSPIAYLGDNKLAVLSNDTTDLVSLMEFNIKTKEYGKILYQHEKYDLIDAKINNHEGGEGGIDYVRFLDHGKLVTKHFHEKNNKLLISLEKAFHGKQIYTISSNRDNSRKIIEVFSSDDPGKYYVLDTKTLHATLLEYLHPQLEDVNLTKSEVFSVKVSDGTEIEAILNKPEDNSNNVLLVYPHGGPIGVRDYDMFDPGVQYLTSRGYSVLKVNFRGSTGYGKEFMASAKGQFGKNIESDISMVVNHVRKKHSFNKMCSIGSSYGGYSAMMLAIYNPDDYQCIIASYGVYDLPLMFNSSNLKRQKDYLKTVRNVIGEESDELKQYSPFHLVDKIKAPVLLIAGRKDEVTGFEQSNRMKYRMERFAIDHEILFYDGVGHGHELWKGDQHEFSYVDDFIRRKLDIKSPVDDAFNEIIKKESLVLADSFAFKDFIDNDTQRALRYYLKAALLGESRAEFNYGAYYHRGEGVEKNLATAISWYKKSSEHGYANASYRLGEIYRRGTGVKIDYFLSYNMYQLAKAQGNRFADIDIAKALCLGMGVEKDVNQCLSLLSFSKKPGNEHHIINTSKKLVKRVKNYRDKIIGSILSDTNFSDEEDNKIKEFLKSEFDIMTTDIKLKISSYGLYIKKNDTYKHIDTTDIISLKDDIIFGIEIVVSNINKIGKRRKENLKSAIKVQWTIPENRDEYGNLNPPQHDIHFPETSTNTHLVYKVNNDLEVIEGEWLVAIFDMNNKKLASKMFYTKK